MQDVFEAALEKLDAQTAQPKRVVVAVSALKKAYRDIQRGGGPFTFPPSLPFSPLSVTDLLVLLALG